MHPDPRVEGIASWKRRFVAGVRQGFWVRFHMALILTAVALAGAVANKLMLRAGLESMAARYPLAILASYAVFFVMVRVWIAYVRAADPRLGGPMAIAAAAAMVAPPGQPGRKRSHLPPNASDAADLALDGPDIVGDVASGMGIDDGVILLVFVLLLVAIFGAGAYVIWEAPVILTEAAFSAVLAAALRRASIEDLGLRWAGVVLRKTVVPFLIVAAMGATAGFVARHRCPIADRMSTALHCPVQEKARNAM